MISKQDLLKIFRKEFDTTLKVMRAFPENKLDFAPHERSSKAKSIMTTFIFEMYLIELNVFGKKIEKSEFQSYLPENLKMILSDFQKETEFVISSLQALSDNEMNKEVRFAESKFTAGDFMLMMLFDQIHHRGQLSTYVRMAGGKVPSIYGPSADDNSTNL
ncbi:MAG: DinB family protein [Ignavibacteriaceae bacterium]|nr:DinB family protein [Ignavibacteriaceae bacterium]